MKKKALLHKKHIAKVKKTHTAKVKIDMFFSIKDYIKASISILLVVIGFVLMYIENEVYGVISLYISPLLIMAGYGYIIYVIMSKKGKNTE